MRVQVISRIHLVAAWILFAPVALPAESTKPAETQRQQVYAWRHHIRATEFSLRSLDPNLYYVALPFNDLAHPRITRKWVPRSWRQSGSSDNSISICKDRWLEIKNEHDGTICYAQWEGTGPDNSDDADYVFGGAPPQAREGIKVSPTVARYLSLSAKHSRLSWRFVEAEKVAPGLWLKNQEQVVLFAALKKIQNPPPGQSSKNPALR